MKLRTLEVCADSLDSVAAALEGGAARVELCSGLAEGGVTPSLGLVKAAVQSGIKVNVLIRPRGGDFVYTPAETECMITDIRAVTAAGANGVVIGALTPEGDVDMELCARLVEAAGEAEITFHRAFDVCREPMKALEDVIALGCNRLLTSGQAPTALEGAGLLAKLRIAAGERLSVMAGSGVSVKNARMIVERSGVNELHASARVAVPSSMVYRNERVKMGAPEMDEYSRMVTSAESVRNIINEINSIK
jgi:copper homeostasis protein